MPNKKQKWNDAADREVNRVDDDNNLTGDVAQDVVQDSMSCITR